VTYLLATICILLFLSGILKLWYRMERNCLSCYLEKQCRIRVYRDHTCWRGVR